MKWPDPDAPGLIEACAWVREKSYYSNVVDSVVCPHPVWQEPVIITAPDIATLVEKVRKVQVMNAANKWRRRILDGYKLSG